MCPSVQQSTNGSDYSAKYTKEMRIFPHLICPSVFIVTCACCLYLIPLYFYSYHGSSLWWLDILNSEPQQTAVKVYDPFFKDLIPDGHDDREAKIARTSQESSSANHMPSRGAISAMEIEHCLQAALAYKLSGKSEKAMKILEHAIAIAPENANVLNRFGEYMEEINNDLLTADSYYFKALTYEPSHEAALMNLERTAHIVEELDVLMFSVIDKKRDLLRERYHQHIDFESKRLIYYMHIYHSVGIEGNTMTMSQLKYLIETGRAVAGKSILEHNEILGLELAFQFLKELSRSSYIGIAEILELHRRVMGHADPLSSGIFRDQQVFVGKHIPPPPEEIPSLMSAYVRWLNSADASQMHPLRYAALAHYKLVDIHPFADGNGRTSRLIMNLILIRSNYPPVIIYKEDRKKYYDYLNLANRGDLRPFVRFISYCTDETLNTYLGTKKLSQIGDEHTENVPVIEIDAIQN